MEEAPKAEGIAGRTDGIDPKPIRKYHPHYGVQSMIDELPDWQRISYGKGYKLFKEHGLLQKWRKLKGLTKRSYRKGG